MRIVYWTLSIAALTAFSSPTTADQKAYAIVIGNNAPPPKTNLSYLRYADDDAVRYYQFFKRLTDSAVLLTLPDRKTQRRYAGIAAKAAPPTMEELRKATTRLSKEIEANKQAGHETVVYVTFSGHGAFADDGVPYLSLLNARLSGATLYDEILSALDADYLHLFIDACHAEGIVGSRGFFSKETTAETVTIGPEERQNAFNQHRRESFPGLGVIVASTQNAQAHEWSAVESGIFTHEVLSGLHGAADINLDGKIEYSELLAFVSSANTAVPEVQGKIDMVASPPARNANVPIVDLEHLSEMAYVEGDPAGLGHFYIELEDGVRFLDANLGNMHAMRIAVPKSPRAYLHTQTQEALISLEDDSAVSVTEMNFQPRAVHSRGSITDALREGLFATRYGRDYYQGYVDSNDLVAVRSSTSNVSIEADSVSDSRWNVKLRRPLAMSAFGLAGVAGVSAAVFGGLALSAKNNIDETDLQRTATKENDKYTAFGTATWISAGVVAAGALAGTLLLLVNREDNTKNVSATIHGDQPLGLSLTF